MAMTEVEQEQEYDRIRAEAHIDRGECLFPDSHAPGHSADERFGVRFDYGEWEELTETEMVEKYGYVEDGQQMLPSFQHGSHWDFWYAP